MEDVRFEPLDVIEAGAETMVILMQLRARGGVSGAGVEMKLVYVNRLRNGKIISSRTYQALPEALEAAGLSE
jgi:ketosteroid isomerase-like protein